MVFLKYYIFIYCSSKALATPRKKPNNPHGVATPGLETIGVASRSRLNTRLFDTEEQS